MADRYKKFKNWWDGTIVKKLKGMNVDDIAQGSSIIEGINIIKLNDLIYVQIDGEHLENKEEIVYRQYKQTGTLQIYLYKDDKMEKVYNHFLTQLNRNVGKKRVRDDDDFSQSMRLNATTYESGFRPPSVPRFSNSYESNDEDLPSNSLLPRSDNTAIPKPDLFEQLLRDPQYSNSLERYIESRVDKMVEQKLSQIKDGVKGNNRVIKKSNPHNCAWIKLYPGEDQHEFGNKKCNYLPIEVFQDNTIKYEIDENSNPDNAMLYVNQFTVCKKCRNRDTEADNIFYHVGKRNFVCAICKNTQTKNVIDTLPICSQCEVVSTKRNIDQDWNKTLLKQLITVIKQQFYGINLEYIAEYQVPNDKAVGSGNHQKRCDFVIHFTVNHIENGQSVCKKIVILIELDKGQKSELTEEKTKKDITEAIYLKVKHLNKKFNPSVLGIWKVNHDGQFKNEFNLTVNDCGLYQRMVILRQYVIFVIYNWDKLPKQFVWYFWYDTSKSKKIRDLWRNRVDDDVPDKCLYFIHNAPHDKDHPWKYCVDPTEGGATYKSKEDNKMVEDANKNPYMKTIVEKRKTPQELFGKFPFCGLKHKLPILK